MNMAGTIVDDSVDDDPVQNSLHRKPALQGSKRNIMNMIIKLCTMTQIELTLLFNSELRFWSSVRGQQVRHADVKVWTLLQHPLQCSQVARLSRLQELGV